MTYSDVEIDALAKDRIKKDNHNMSKWLCKNMDLARKVCYYFQLNGGVDLISMTALKSLEPCSQKQMNGTLDNNIPLVTRVREAINA